MPLDLDLIDLLPKPHPLFLEVVDHEEYVEFDEESRTPIEGTRTAFLRLKDPDGRIVRAEIQHGDLDPLLALIWPEDFCDDAVAVVSSS